MVGIPKEEHDKVLLELSGLRDALGKTRSAFDAMRARVQALDLGQSRMDNHLELVIRIQQRDGKANLPSSSASKFTWEGSRYGLSKPT